MSTSNQNIIQYPAQNGLYAVKVKNKNCSDWHKFKSVRLEISVGQPYHEGEKLRAALSWCKYRFDDVHILVNDTLQRFNYIFDEQITEDQAFQKAEKAGCTWIERNSTLISSIPHAHIHRWENWRDAEQFKIDLAKSEKMYHEKDDFRSVIDTTIRNHWQRKLVKDGSVISDRSREFFDLSRRYLIEETAIFAQIYRTIPGISVYPGSFMEIWNMFLDKKMPDVPEGLDKAYWMRIDFAKNKTLLSQTVN